MTAEQKLIAEIERVSSEPCACVSCGSCGGTGNVWYSFDGKYLGNHRSDDMDELERCEDCEGGITEACDRCQALSDLYTEQQQAEWDREHSHELQDMNTPKAGRDL